MRHVHRSDPSNHGASKGAVEHAGDHFTSGQEKGPLPSESYDLRGKALEYKVYVHRNDSCLKEANKGVLEQAGDHLISGQQKEPLPSELNDLRGKALE